MSDARQSIASESLERGYETTDAKAKPLILFVIGLILLTLACMLVTKWILAGLEGARKMDDVSLHPLAEPVQVPPAPRLQDKPAEDIREHRAIEAELIDSYQWIDREHGVVRIPVERAMELLVEREAKR